jgi:ATP-dependent helicase HrpA
MPRTKSDFENATLAIRDKLVAQSEELATHLLTSLKLLVDVKKNIKQQKNALVLAFALSDIQEQLKNLFYVGLVYKTPEEWLRQYPRYLRGIQARLEKAALNPQKDKLALMEIQPYWQRLQEYIAKEGAFVMTQNAALVEYRWWIEELRISLFAQTLKTQVPISPKRLDKQWELVLSSN